MFLSSLIKELCTKEETNKTGYILTFGGQCINVSYGGDYKRFRTYYGRCCNLDMDGSVFLFELCVLNPVEINFSALYDAFTI